MSDEPRTDTNYEAALLTLLAADPEDIRRAALKIGASAADASESLAAAFREVHEWKSARLEWGVDED